ncbi:hypothetical protein [Tenacibaculum amylolyticum]|uniref:hypothetical protein n=1 Tax=Tenacibaculum amylolyticum TaxID=104269 RepID=UPI0038941BC8
MNVKKVLGFGCLGLFLLIAGVSIFVLYKIGSSPLVEMYSTTVTVDEISDEEKEVLFVGMHHIGLETFYKNVQKEVIKAKKEGYVLFYEYVDYTNETDTTLLQKTRKLAGLVPSPENYAKMVAKINADSDDSEKLVAQNNALFLHQVNDKDFNIDLTPKEIINAYEKKYGVIQLSKIDKETPIDESIEETLPQEGFEAIILNLRNEHLAKAIEESKYPKILVLYGSAHKEGLLTDLQKLNPNWKQIETEELYN